MGPLGVVSGSHRHEILKQTTYNLGKKNQFENIKYNPKETKRFNKINNGYKKLLKPLNKMPAYNMAMNDLSAFTLILLQSIIAKRVIAPAISTPLAAKMKKKFESK